MKIVVITPVRNEEKYIPVTIKCMLRQTVLPVRWIIVNDGSTDNTEKIVRKHTKTNSFIQYVSLPDRGKRKPGQGVVETFYEGFNKIGNLEYDILAKFDADLKFPPDTLEKISQAFLDDPSLGITGGTRYERRDDQSSGKKVLVPKGFVGGPFKFYRKKCFEDIDGLINRAGWDGVDAIRANMNGWKTGEIESLKILHLKPTGTANGEGLHSACLKYGDVSYYMGGYVWYFVLRAVGRSIQSMDPKVGYYIIKGYMNAVKSKAKREDMEFRDFLKKNAMEKFGVFDFFRFEEHSKIREEYQTKQLIE